jgi:Galactose oxidase, central domain/Kelch motif
MLRPRAVLVTLAAVSLAAAFSLLHTHNNVSAGAAPAGSVRPGAPLLDPRSGHTATLLQNGRVLIAGGMRRNQDFYRSAELYDPATGKFQATGSMNLARVGAAAALLRSGSVLVVGGFVGHACTDSAELYNPSTGRFMTIGRMTTARGRPNTTLLADGDVLISGGADHDSPGGVASAEIFRSASSKFEAVGSMHAGRIAQTSTLLNDGRVLIAGGRGDSVTASAEIYDPATKKFSLTGDMITARYKHTAGLLPDGRVLIAGGSDERDWRSALASAEIYDPRAGKFTATSPLNDSRFKLPYDAAQLASGELLIAGGSKNVELYEPATGKFLLASGQIDEARHFMSETKLKDGSVLLAGGYPNDDQATSETWIYHPR